MIQYKRDKRKLFQYINKNKKYFEAMDEDSYQMVKMLMKSEKWLERIEDKAEEGERNMCKALEDLYNDGVEKGIEKGIEKGLRSLVIKKHHAGLTDEVIAEFIEKSVEYVRSIIMEEQQIA